MNEADGSIEQSGSGNGTKRVSTTDATFGDEGGTSTSGATTGTEERRE
jgi:hypothetical protein